MNISIWFSWPAGSWVNTAGLLLWELLSQKGFNVLADKEYVSIIKGGNNCFFLYITDNDTPHISKTIDLFFAFDDYAITKNEKIYALKNILNIKTLAKKHKNIFAFWASLKALWISKEEGIVLLEKTFSQAVLDENKEELLAWYEYFDTVQLDFKIDLDFSKNIWPQKLFMFGNELIAKWAIDSWLEFYSAYPMTPASSIIDIIVKYPEKVTFFQWEDEIAVGMSMLWAKFAGKRAVCWTSGWWFALMSEGISFSNQAEIWWVYVLSQRDGPSTGTPTFTAQGDLFYAMNASFGDTQPIVYAPSKFEELYTDIWKALNWSDIYQHPVIFLLDKQLSESYKSIATDLQAEPIDRGVIAESKQNDEYLRYKLTDTGISPYAVPGQENTTFIATSYEHTESWETNEDPVIKWQQMEKRMKKLQTFVQKEFNEFFYGYEIINPNAKKFYVTRGMNCYSIEYAIQNKANWWLIVIKSFQPFDKRLKKFFQEKKDNIEKLVFVEMNYLGQMQQVVMRECNLLDDSWQWKIYHIRKNWLYPFFYEEITD